MSLTPSNYSVFVTNVNAMIGAVYNQDDVASVWAKIATQFPATSKQLEFGWTGVMPKMRPWFGARQPHQPAPQTYTVKLQVFENTYSIDQFDLDDDMYGIYYRMLPDLARQAKRHPDYQIRDLIEASGIQGSASIQLGFDGLTHWNSAHPINLYDSSAGTYTNTTLGGQSIGGVTIGGTFSPTAFTSVYEYMMTIKGEDGERLGIKPNILMHPPTLETEVQLVLKSTFFSPPAWGAYSPISSQVGAADNPLRRFGVEPLMNQFLNDNDNWFLLDTTKAFKPFLWIVRNETVTVPRVNPNDDNVFTTHMFQYGQWNRVAPAWDYAFLSHRSGPT